jgi:hypothetical protein
MRAHIFMPGNADCRKADMRQHTCILVVALLVAAVVAQVQQARQGHRIGVLLYYGAPPGLPEAFGEGLQELGYAEGNNLTLEWRNARGSTEQLAALAEDLVRLKVDLIVAVNTPAALAAAHTPCRSSRVTRSMWRLAASWRTARPCCRSTGAWPTTWTES